MSMSSFNGDTRKFDMPFAGFLSYLRRQGFIIGVDHHMRLQELLNKLGPGCRPADLPYLLCPIFATSEKQQQQFYRSFDSYFKPLQVDEIHEKFLQEGPGGAVFSKSAPPGRRRQETPDESVTPPKWQYILLGVLLVILAALLSYRLGNGGEIKIKPQENLGLPQPGLTTETNGQKPAGDDGSKASPGGRKGDKLNDLKTPGDILSDLLQQYSYIFRWLGVLLPIIIFLLMQSYRYNRRRLILVKQRGKKPPFVWPVKVETPEGGPVKNERFYQAARFLRKRLKSDINCLDIDRTISSTVARAGFPGFRYKTLTRPPEYLILIDLPAYRDHYSHLCDSIARALAKEGLFVIRFFYEKDPRVCFKEPNGQRFYLSDLKTRYSDHRLIIFGDGEEFLDPISGEMDKWTVLFHAWPERAILTPEHPQKWSMREIVLAREFILVPASLNGLYALNDYFEMPVEPDLKTWKQADERSPVFQPGMQDHVDQLREYLGEDNFQWLCACAVYPELHWDLTLYLGSLPCMAEGLISEENLLQLLRLPWFRTGTMPDELRGELINKLDTEKSKAIRTAIIDLLEKNPAPKESFAFDTYHLHLVVQRWMLSRQDRKKRKELLKSLISTDEKRVDYTLLRFLESTLQSPLHFVLPTRLRKVFYNKGVPFLGLKTGIRVCLTVLIAAAAFLLLKPPGMDMPPGVPVVIEKAAEVYKNEKGFWEADYGNDIIMVYIPRGEFTMGSNDYKDERPPHKVVLDGYWMGKTEVTVGQYKAFISESGHRSLPSWVSEYSPGDDYPVVYVSWDDADAYCKWLSANKGIKFKLPTEAQWEKAARGTDSRKYPWGNSPPTGKKVNFSDSQLLSKQKGYTWADKDVDDGYAYTAPVGSYPAGASPYGLLDMAGNVWEWCSDWYGSEYYKNAPDDNPTGPGSGSYRVIRGGSWCYYAWGLRCALRSGDGPSYRFDDLGFRLCQDD